jgi:hypothetical protein
VPDKVFKDCEALGRQDHYLRAVTQAAERRIEHEFAKLVSGIRHLHPGPEPQGHFPRRAMLRHRSLPDEASHPAVIYVREGIPLEGANLESVDVTSGTSSLVYRSVLELIEDLLLSTAEPE